MGLASLAQHQRPAGRVRSEVVGGDRPGPLRGRLAPEAAEPGTGLCPDQLPRPRPPPRTQPTPPPPPPCVCPQPPPSHARPPAAPPAATAGARMAIAAT